MFIPLTNVRALRSSARDGNGGAHKAGGKDGSNRFPGGITAPGDVIQLAQGQGRVLALLGFQERLYLLEGRAAAVGFQEFFLLASLGRFDELGLQFLAGHDLVIQFLNGFHINTLLFQLQITETAIAFRMLTHVTLIKEFAAFAYRPPYRAANGKSNDRNNRFPSG